MLAVRNDVLRWVARAMNKQDVFQRFYQFTDLPSHTSGSTVALIVVLTIVISTLAGLFPAWRAARLKPVEALRGR